MEQELRKKNLDLIYAIFRSSLTHAAEEKSANHRLLDTLESYCLKKFKIKCEQFTFNQNYAVIMDFFISMQDKPLK